MVDVSSNKTKTQKTIEEMAAWYIYNPHTPYYFKHPDDWLDYFKSCSDMSIKCIKGKMQWLHNRISYWWHQHRQDKRTAEYYQKHYLPDSKPEDKLNPLFMPGRMSYDVITINRRIEKSWIKPPPAMASNRYWESFLYNCMELKVIEKLDGILVELLNFVNRKKEKPPEDKSKALCLNYLQERKKTVAAQIQPVKKRTW